MINPRCLYHPMLSNTHVYRVNIYNDYSFPVTVLLNLYQRGSSEKEREYLYGPYIRVKPQTQSELFVESAPMEGMSLSRLYAKIFRFDKMLEVNDKGTYKISQIMHSDTEMSEGFDWLDSTYDPYDDLP